ncbi:MAG: thiamine-phosphate kinase [Gammaproteobacteria bacterium]|nr:MAG: thiamine-phosphate kinase [Gammaproteobacteria bacterium]
MPVGEFELIERYFRDRGARRADVLLGVGDDAAIVRVPPDQELVLALDVINGGIHFPDGSAGAAVGHRALAVNLSDLAAMGADPAWALLGLSLPAADEAWIADFADGFAGLANRFGVAWVGGDTTRGPLSASVMAAGLVPVAQALRRAGAIPGDEVWVSGTPGDAAAGLALLQGRIRSAAPARAELVRRFEYPEPRVGLGCSLRGIASACIDVSDGLAGDLGRLCAASGVGAELDAARLPLSPALLAAAGPDSARVFALTGGDDYELLFTAPPVMRPRLEARAGGPQLSRIGTIVTGAGVCVSGAPPGCEPGHGFDHFARGPADSR